MFDGRRIKKQQNAYVRGELSKLTSGESLVSDSEVQDFENKQREAAQATITGQQQVLNRAAMANAAGNPVLAGAIKESAEGLAKGGETAAIAASGAANRFKNEQHEARKAAILGVSFQARAANQTDAQMNRELAASLMDTMWPEKK